MKPNRAPDLPDPPPAHSATYVSGCSWRWRLGSILSSDSSPLELFNQGGGFHQPVSAMLSGSAGSPFRSNSGHRAPWPPPALHAATEGFGRFGAGGGGGLYSLFPGPGGGGGGGGGGGASEASAAIYSQATSAAARFAHSANTYHNFIGAHKVADSLFSSGYTFGGPTPPPPPTAAPPYSPVSPLVERGITQLELMAKGFNNNNNNSNTNNNNLNGVGTTDSNTIIVGNNKKVENKRRSECALYQESVERRQQQAPANGGGTGAGNKRRWERDNSQAPHTPPIVKSEVTSRPSCGCRRSTVSTSSPSPLAIRNGNSHHSNGTMASSDNNGVASFPLQQCNERKHEPPEPSSGERKKHDALVASSGGCSRTNPISLRNGGNMNSVSDWPNGGLVQIKKEPVSSSGGSATPCLQVAEVTTSIRPHQQQNVVANLSAPSPLAAVVKLEAVPCSASSCNGGINSISTKSMQHPSINSSAIPVGIAVARQRLQDHSLQSSGTKPDIKPPQGTPCRQQKTIAPAPPEPQCSAAELAPAPAPQSLSAMVLQQQCDERSTNGLAPWAATSNHNPALTPPTLWQYPAHVPVQLGPAEHLPLPPVGYQLVRDPITGHFLLIPTTNIEHLQRTVLWPGYPTTATTVQPSLQVTTTQQPATQHIQLFEPTEPPDYLAAPATRILVQPQLTIATAAAATATAVTVATDTAQGVAKRTTKQQATTLIKIEPAHTASDCNGGTTTGIVVENTNMKSLHRMSPLSTSRPTTTEVSVATNTTPVSQTITGQSGAIFSSGATTATTALQAHFYYEHHTHHPTSAATAAVVQLSQTPQPSASVQTDNGKRSQATSPVNPAETCLTPPPEAAANQSECEDVSTSSTIATGVDQGCAPQQAPTPVQQVTVQDASNQTDTPPVSEDENCCDSDKLQPKQEVPESSTCDVKPLCNEALPPFESKPQLDETQVVDLSGLELLSNSIEQFENNRIHHRDGLTQKRDDASTNISAGSTCVSAKLPPTSPCSSSADTKQDISDEKAAETLQMLCQQSSAHQMKSSIERLTVRKDLSTPFNEGGSTFSENCDSKVLNATSGQVCTGDLSDVSNVNAECSDVCITQSSESDSLARRVESMSGGTNMLGGLGLLCALAEQRILEEVGASGEGASSTPETSGTSRDNIYSSTKLLRSSPEVSGTGVDVNRNYKTRKSEQECKKFIASKVMQYYHNGTGNNSGSSSPQHCSQQLLQPQQVVSLCASPSSSSAEIMDAMELNMRMKLAELQRKYREKQRELSKLTPKKSSLSDVTSSELSDAPMSASPVKRGPGRPRKKCNKLCLDSPPLSPPGSVGSTVPRPRVGRPPLLKSRDASRELPPPVLEKVTDLNTRPRPRFDTDEDCAAPKLKASKLDILKPPTLTANRILTCAKFKPSSVCNNNNNNIVAKGLKLPQCNVNLVKLATSHNGSVTKVKDASGKLMSESGANRKGNDSSPLGELRSKHGSLAAVPELSIVEKQRSGESDSLFWFKTAASKTSNLSKSQQQERSSPVLEIAEVHKPKLSPSPPPLSPSVPPCLSSSSSTSSTSSSSKKRKVGRPKKHFSATGREIATETIFAKKPKSKSSLVGLLLSKSRHTKPTHPLSHKSLTNSHSHLDSPVSSYSNKIIPSHKTNGHSSDGTSLYQKTPSRNNGSTYSDTESNSLKTTGVNGFTKNATGDDGVPKRTGPCLTTPERKPNKIRPKLKAEAKIKTWSWCEDEDPVPMDWPGSKAKPSEPVITPLSQSSWSKKTESKNEKPAAKAVSSSVEIVSRARKRKASSVEPKSTALTSTTNGNTGASALSTPASSKPLKKPKPGREKRDKAAPEVPSPAKKQKRSSSSVGQGTTSSESEDIPLSVLSKQNASSTAPCQLTQAHLNTEKQRALTVMGGLFYAGTLSAIRAPDVYGITLDGERGNRPHIYSREEILRDAILEVRPTNINELTPGTRVCAYWSQQYRCLYPGTVAQPSSPDPELDLHFVSVEFDDGDSGRINIDDIRLLPIDYPIVEYDPNPLLSLGKRRRRNSGASCESHSKDRRASAETANNNNNNKKAASTQKQVPQSKETPPRTDETVVDNADKKQQLPGVCKTSPNGKSMSKVTVPGPTKQSAIGSPLKMPVDSDMAAKTEMSDRSSSSSSGRERKRLKKRRREKLKRLLASATVDGGLTVGLKKHRKKHRCSGGGEEHCRHKKHHKRHRKHRHRNHNSSRNKDCSSGSSSAESGSRQGHEGDALSRLSPVLEQLDILEIQQTAIRQLTTEQEAVTAAAIVTAPATETATVTPAITSTDADESETEAEQEEAIDEATEISTNTGDNKKTKKDKEGGKPKKGRDRQPSVESRSKMAAFLPARQLWGWSGRGFKRPGAKGRGKKEFYKAIQRGKETIRVGDCAVFLSTGRPDRPYIGRIESMWEAWGTNMVVRVKWFYHPEETNGCPSTLQYPGALFESPHVDENDVQTISHKCEVLPLEGYTGRLGSEPQRYSTVYDNNDIYYLAGYYDPTTSQLTIEPGVV